MGKIFIDGEAVEFDGDAPASCSEAIAVIENYLGGQGLTIGSLELNGEGLPIETAMGVGEYECLSFHTVSPQGQLLAMCREWSSRCAERASEAKATAGVVLRSSWNDSQAKVVNLLEGLRPILEGLGVVHEFGKESGAGWSDAFSAAYEAGIGSIDVVVDAVQTRECVSLSDRLATGLAATWGAMAVVLSDQVVPALERGVES